MPMRSSRVIIPRSCMLTTMSQAVGRQIESNKSSKDSTRSQDALELETLRRELEQLKVTVEVDSMS